MKGRSRTGVFLSYSRKDEAFATDLRERLKSAGIDVRQDRTILEGGIGWWNQITEALNQAEFLVLVMSAAAIESDTVRKEWDYARNHGVCVYPVKVPEKSFDFDLLPGWMRKAHFYDPEKEFEKLVAHLLSPCRALHVPFMAPDLPNPFVQRRTEFEALRRSLLTPQGEPAPVTASMHGAPSFGKTTLAAAVCHDPQVINAFDDGILWITLGEHPNIATAIRSLYSALTGEEPAFVDEHDAAYRFWQKVADRNCLLVIDDIWDAEHLKLFLERGPGCARLVTTRRFDLSIATRAVRVDEMSQEEAVQILTSGLGVDDARFQTLVRRLGQWPLLIRLALGTLREEIGRTASLDQALNYLDAALAEEGAAGYDLFRASVELNLRHLEPPDRERGTELAIFPEDLSIPVPVIRAFWGFSEFRTQQVLRRLDNLYLVRLDVTAQTVSLHDVMRAFFAGKLSSPAALHSRLVDAWGDPHHLPGPYAWRWFAFHLSAAGRKPELRRVLLDLDWLSRKLAATSISELIADFDYLRGDSDTDLVQSALRLSAHVLAADPAQLAAQLSGRLLSSGSPDIASMLKSAVGSRGGRTWLRPLAANLVTPGGGLVRTFEGHSDVVHAVTFTAEGEVLSASADGSVRLWDLESGREIAQLQSRGKPVKSLALTTDGRVLAGAADCTVKIWDLKSRTLLNSVGGFPHWIEAIQIWADQIVVCGCFDGSIAFWDLNTLSALPINKEHKGRIYGLALTGNGAVISASDDHLLKVWELNTGTEIRSLTGHQAAVSCVAVFDDGRKAISASADDTIRIWDLDTGQQIHMMSTPNWVLDIALLDGARRALTVSNDTTVRLLDCEAGTEIRSFEGHVESVLSVVVTPDARRALTASVDRTVRVWDIETKTSALPSPRHGRAVNCSAVTADGKCAVTASVDGVVKVWDLSAGRETGTLSGHTGPLRSLAAIGNDRVLSGG